jgi:prepilin-type N-terminal cleavage/methylation domain-containing protein
MINSNGFTLIELLIAISVITVGIAGAFIATQQSISVIHYANSRFTAALLAQEAVEIIKSIRDTNLLQSVAWSDGFSSAGDYEVEYTDAQSATPSLSNVFCSPDCFNDLNFLQKTDNGFYNYTPATDTKFKRKVHVTSISPDELELEIIVYWRKRGGGHHELILKQHIYNWLNI